MLASRTLCSYIPVSDHWLEIARDWCDALVCVITLINGGNMPHVHPSLVQNESGIQTKGPCTYGECKGDVRSSDEAC